MKTVMKAVIKQKGISKARTKQKGMSTLAKGVLAKSPLQMGQEVMKNSLEALDPKDAYRRILQADRAWRERKQAKAATWKGHTRASYIAEKLQIDGLTEAQIHNRLAYGKKAAAARKRNAAEKRKQENQEAQLESRKDLHKVAPVDQAAYLLGRMAVAEFTGKLEFRVEGNERIQKALEWRSRGAFTVDKQYLTEAWRPTPAVAALGKTPRRLQYPELLQLKQLHEIIPSSEPSLAPWLQAGANTAFLWALYARLRSPDFIAWVRQSGVATADDATIRHAFAQTYTVADLGRASVVTTELSALSRDLAERNEKLTAGLFGLRYDKYKGAFESVLGAFHHAAEPPAAATGAALLDSLSAAAVQLRGNGAHSGGYVGKNVVDMLPALPQRHRGRLIDSISLMKEVGTGGNVAALVTEGRSRQVAPETARPVLQRLADSTRLELESIRNFQIRAGAGPWRQLKHMAAGAAPRTIKAITSLRITQLTACKTVSIVKAKKTNRLGKARRMRAAEHTFVGIVP